MYERHGQQYELVARLGLATRMLDLHWVRVADGSRMAVRTIGELQIRSAAGVSVVGVYGARGFIANPGPEYRFEAGDLVAVVGSRDQLAAFGAEAASRGESLADRRPGVA